MIMPFHDQTVNTLRSTVEAACSDQQKGVPGAVVVVVDKNGNELFSHAAGQRGVASSENLTTDSIFWIASCTKVVTGIACMQLVEKEVLGLDDGEQLETLCPELKTLQVLRDNASLEDKRRAITLRMLLSHTAGLAYSFFNEKLRDYKYPAGVDEFSGRFEEFLQPLVSQPGERWEYSVSSSWEQAQGILCKASWDMVWSLVFVLLTLGADGYRLGWCRPGESDGRETQRLHEGQHIRTARYRGCLHATLARHGRSIGVHESTGSQWRFASTRSSAALPTGGQRRG